MKAEQEELLVVMASADVARKLGVTPGRIRQMARDGEIRPFAITEGVGISLYLKADVETFCAKREAARHQKQEVATERRESRRAEQDFVRHSS